MCAIIGWCGSIEAGVLQALMCRAQPYGDHAAGVAYLDPATSQTFVTKRAGTPYSFVKANQALFKLAAEAKFGLMHVRWKTHGANSDRNAHPFTYQDATFAHNGVISNYQDFTPDAEVDSECLGQLIKARDIQQANGSVGLLWFEGSGPDTKLYCYKRHQQLVVSFFKSPRDHKLLTLVVTNASIWQGCKWLGKAHLKTYQLETGHAYRLDLKDGLVKAWEDNSKFAPPVYAPAYAGSTTARHVPYHTFGAWLAVYGVSLDKHQRNYVNRLLEICCENVAPITQVDDLCKFPDLAKLGSPRILFDGIHLNQLLAIAAYRTARNPVPA